MGQIRYITKEHFERILGRRKTSKPRNLGEVIDKAERDFAAGLGKTFTVEELGDLVHEKA